MQDCLSISQTATVARLRLSLLAEMSSSMSSLSNVTRISGYEITVISEELNMHMAEQMT